MASPREKPPRSDASADARLDAVIRASRPDADPVAVQRLSEAWGRLQGDGRPSRTKAASERAVRHRRRPLRPALLAAAAAVVAASAIAMGLLVERSAPQAANSAPRQQGEQAPVMPALPPMEASSGERPLPGREPTHLESRLAVAAAGPPVKLPGPEDTPLESADADAVAMWLAASGAAEHMAWSRLTREHEDLAAVVERLGRRVDSAEAWNRAARRLARWGTGDELWPAFDRVGAEGRALLAGALLAAGQAERLVEGTANDELAGRTVVEALRRWGQAADAEPEVVSALRLELLGQHADRQQQAAMLLAQLGDEPAVMTLMQATAHPHARRAAVAGLLAMGPLGAEALTLASEHDPAVAATARSLIAAM